MQAVELAGAAVDGDAGRDGDGAGSARGSATSRSATPRAPAEVGAGHDDGQLVGAGAADDVAAADQLAQAGGDGRQRLVAGSGAAAPVERAEAVDVDEDERSRLAAALRAAQRRGGGLPEGIQRQDAGATVLAQVLVALGLQRRDARMRRAQLVTEATGLGEGPLGPVEAVLLEIAWSRHVVGVGARVAAVVRVERRLDGSPSPVPSSESTRMQRTSGPRRRMPPL